MTLIVIWFLLKGNMSGPRRKGKGLVRSSFQPHRAWSRQVDRTLVGEAEARWGAGETRLTREGLGTDETMLTRRNGYKVLDGEGRTSSYS